MPASASEKAALILNLLGHELASRLFAGLPRREQTAVLRSMAGSQIALSDAEVQEICKEFLNALADKTRSGVGGIQSPRDSFAGVELPRASRVNEICEDIPDWILIEHLKNQLDSVISAVLGSIESSRAGTLFKAMPSERQTALLLSLSKERVLEATVLDELEADPQPLVDSDKESGGHSALWLLCRRSTQKCVNAFSKRWMHANRLWQGTSRVGCSRLPGFLGFCLHIWLCFWLNSKTTTLVHF